MSLQKYIERIKHLDSLNSKIDFVVQLRKDQYELFNTLSDSSGKNKVQQDIDSLSKIIELLKSQQITRV